MHALARFTTFILLLSASFTNALPSPPTHENKHLLSRQPPREGLLTITALYTGEACAGPQPYWYISTGTESWFGGLEKTNGCQPVNASWSITSAKAAYLAEGCKISFYTDMECKDNGATPPFDQCVTSNTKETWRSFAIRGCVETSTTLPV
ncbi:hypothetical protein V8F20_011274 [Naviculisporaceae sp. PSN 640]